MSASTRPEPKASRSRSRSRSLRRRPAPVVTHYTGDPDISSQVAMDPNAPQPALPGPAGQQPLDPAGQPPLDRAGQPPVDCAGQPPLDPADCTALHAVALQLSPLWTDDPDFWFDQAKAQFALRGIAVDATKYFYVIGALNPATSRRVRPFLRAPPRRVISTRPSRLFCSSSSASARPSGRPGSSGCRAWVTAACRFYWPTC
ncbi:uncharacterized protein LOC144598900 [Rhinoraja longicauda]